MQTQHPGAYRRSARPLFGVGKWKEKEKRSQEGSEQMKIRKTSS
jgi:hypothetical protein